ncbi:MAG TPA: hypothetical protein VMK31_06255 [Sphingomicrobium sp.]|nr:hypothetical protein [Sphingomicrobium sp.]
MDDGGLSAALDRAQSALERVEQALLEQSARSGRDEDLRGRVREAVAELDQIIKESS